ncbi:Hypothetical protein, putative [Bodo saltans]|uniref:Potassium channel tetramerisation-type BTB domain-containing protein n=1 Tax=Bodo saltans TaxID=75058 RepID=A0A0S4JTG3_BODSA|nr:Hypothetical protein, putative [Bodo saltans]|eukprot:CUG94103.1 Hypothetical protein, putative [Bodo saltans]
MVPRYSVGKNAEKKRKEKKKKKNNTQMSLDDLQMTLIEDTATGSSSSQLRHNNNDGRNDTLVTFNIRGTFIVIPATTADDHPSSTLWKVLRDVQRPPPIRDGQGNLFFNRNPTLFHAMLDVVVNDQSSDASKNASSNVVGLADELRFWGIRAKRSRDDEPLTGQRSNNNALPSTAQSAATTGFRAYGAMEVSYAKDSPFAFTR